MLKLLIILCLTMAPRASAAEPAAVKTNPNLPEWTKEYSKGKSGNVEKQAFYGFAYWLGLGVPKDPAKAGEILRLPAERGYAMAQGALGQGLTDGTAGKKDMVEAARWLELAAEQGNTSAQLMLALQHMPVTGERPADSLPADAEKSYFWTTLAMLTEDSANPGKWRKAVMETLPAERIAALDARLLAWEPKQGVAWKGQKGIAYLPCFPCMARMADNGDPYAQWMMGNVTGMGLVFPKDDAKSIAWYRRSAAQGHLWGQRSLAEAYYFGRGVPVDNAEAYFWISPIADAATKEGWYDDDIDLQMVAEDSYDKIGKERAEEIDRKRSAWKPVPEKKAAKPKAP